jgi:Cu-Zn family superoxide dismutase
VTSTGEEETKFEIEDTLVSLYGLLSVVGRSIVIHELEDDEGLGGWPDSKINGHSGARLACGVIGWTTNE